MDPNVWGPKFWFSIHSVTFTYPFYPDQKDKLRYKTFFEMLEFVLPCVVCRVNYSKNIKNFPIDRHLKDRKSLVHWGIDLHNTVNIENGKPALTYKEVLDIYEGIYGRKIHLEDPEPHVTHGKNLSDEEWKNAQEMKTLAGKLKKDLQRYFIYGALAFLIIMIIFSIHMLRKK